MQNRIFINKDNIINDNMQSSDKYECIPYYCTIVLILFSMRTLIHYLKFPNQSPSKSIYMEGGRKCVELLN